MEVRTSDEATLLWEIEQRAAARPALSEGAQKGLDNAWRAVDACGGNYSPDEEANGYAKAHARALDEALAAIEQLGGRPS